MKRREIARSKGRYKEPWSSVAKFQSMQLAVDLKLWAIAATSAHGKAATSCLVIWKREKNCKVSRKKEMQQNKETRLGVTDKNDSRAKKEKHRWSSMCWIATNRKVMRPFSISREVKKINHSGVGVCQTGLSAHVVAWSNIFEQRVGDCAVVSDRKKTPKHSNQDATWHHAVRCCHVSGGLKKNLKIKVWVFGRASGRKG